MRVLVTGNRGRLGSAIEARLRADSHDVVGFDRADGEDVRDVAALMRAVDGCDAVVHVAGLADDRGADGPDVIDVNLVGTYNVLTAAKTASAERVIYFSSGKALGMVARPPASLPLDDEHRVSTFSAYGLSKWLAEQMCEAFTDETGISTICLRPVAVLSCTADYEAYERSQSTGNGWHLGAYVDLRDVVTATQAALACAPPGHVRLLLCAEDIAGRRPTRGFVQEYLPGVPWQDSGVYPGDDGDVRRALVDCSAAQRVLGWRPRVRWTADRCG